MFFKKTHTNNPFKKTHTNNHNISKVLSSLPAVLSTLNLYQYLLGGLHHQVAKICGLKKFNASSNSFLFSGCPAVRSVRWVQPVGGHCVHSVLRHVMVYIIYKHLIIGSGNHVHSTLRTSSKDNYFISNEF